MPQTDAVMPQASAPRTRKDIGAWMGRASVLAVLSGWCSAVFAFLTVKPSDFHGEVGFGMAVFFMLALTAWVAVLAFIGLILGILSLRRTSAKAASVGITLSLLTFAALALGGLEFLYEAGFR